MAQRTYERLKERFATWDDATSSRAVRTILHPAGLATIKSKQIRSALNRIQTDFGTCDLSALRKVSEDDAQHYLTALPGVSQKVAKCVMMYTLGFHVLPVDTHVHRVTKRLGWTKKNRADQCHEELEELVRPKLRYTFHVDCIAHGRAICRPSDPLCAQCPIKRYCAHFKNTKI
jgi:endonuclease III